MEAFTPNFRRPATSSLPEPARDGCRLEPDIVIPMRDGVRLAIDIYFPAQPGKYPVLVERTPYGKHQSVMLDIGAPQYLARAGFVVAIQDTRGRYASEGIWYPFRDEAWGTARDSHDTVEWLARQPWCTGKVGTFGGSYSGFNQYSMAGDLPEHLGAMFARQGPCSLRRSWVYRGGALELGFIVSMFAGRQFPEALRNRSEQLARAAHANQHSLLHCRPEDNPLFSNPFTWLDDYISRQEDEGYWAQWDVACHHAAMDCPIWHMASWFDIFVGGSLENFIGMRANAKTEEARRQHRLIVGPWLHGPWTHQLPQGRLAGEMDFGETALWDYNREMSRWFEYWLKGTQNGVTEEPAVRYFVMGLNQWKTADDWPPPGSAYRTLYFIRKNSGTAHSLFDGGLDTEPPGETADPVDWLHDPERPVPSLGGATLFFLARKAPGEAPAWDDFNAEAGSRDQRPTEAQCVTFTSDALLTDWEATGPVIAKLYISSSAVDTDFHVRLCDVFPDGRAMLICDGVQRARYRASDFRSLLLRPGEVTIVTVDLWATSYLFRAGHRIRVIISSSCFPRYDINPGTGESALRTTRRVQAANRIHLGPTYPSHIRLPFYPGENSQKEAEI